MTLRPARIAVPVFLVLVLMLGIWTGIRVRAAVTPEKLASFLEQRLARQFDSEFSIAAAFLSVRGGPEVTMTELRMENPTVGSMASDKAVVGLSLFPLLRGNVVPVSIELERPVVKVRAAVSLPGAVGGDTLPGLHVREGTLVFGPESNPSVVEHIEAIFDGDTRRLTADVLGGEAFLELEKRDGAWRGGGALSNVEIGEVLTGTGKSSKMNLTVEISQDGRSVSCETSLEGFSLSWWTEEIEHVDLSFTAGFDNDSLHIDDLAISTPLINLVGEAILERPGGTVALSETLLRANVGTGPFDYERFVSKLPTRHFPEWLSRLLCDQIRGGTVIVTNLRYRGTLGGLVSGKDVPRGLVVEGVLSGQRFCAGHDHSSVEDISGRAELSEGTLAFRDLAARAGSSIIDSLDLVFHNITNDDMRLSLSLLIDDMKLADFVTAWHASMVPEDLHALLDSFSNAEEGRIGGRVETETDTSLPEPTKIRGEVRLKESSFTWRNRRFTSMSGTAVKKDYDTPLKATAAGDVDGFALESLELDIPDPLGDGTYEISFILPDLSFAGDVVEATGTRARFNGTGRKNDIEGTVTLATDKLKVNGDVFGPSGGIIEGTGLIRLFTGSEPGVELDKVRFDTTAGTVVADGAFNEGGGRITLSGDLDLSRVENGSDNRIHLLEGSVAGRAVLAVETGETGGVRVLNGRLTCGNARFLYGDEAVVVDGTVTADAESCETSRLSMTWNGMTVEAAGRLAISEPRHFSGSLSIDGASIADTLKPTFAIPGGFGIDADVIATNVTLRGIPVQAIHAGAVLDEKTLRLEDMECLTESGSVTGTVAINREGGGSVDLAVDLKNHDAAEILGAFSTTGKSGLDGMLSLEGHLFGELDSLNGELSVKVMEGQLRKYGVISKIFTVTNIYRLITSDRVGFGDEGFAFTSITSRPVIRDGVASFDDFRLESPSIQMSAVGNYRLNEAIVDAVVVIQPLETVDRLINLIPVVNWILLGKEKRLVVIGAEITGDISDPEVTITPLDTIAKPVTGILLRTLRLPVDVIISPGKIIPGAK